MTVFEEGTKRLQNTKLGYFLAHSLHRLGKISNCKFSDKYCKRELHFYFHFFCIQIKCAQKSDAFQNIYRVNGYMIRPSVGSIFCCLQIK